MRKGRLFRLRELDEGKFYFSIFQFIDEKFTFRLRSQVTSEVVGLQLLLLYAKGKKDFIYATH